jgi:putative FmdB family regulatory protein
MPIYEFACPQCRVIFSFLSKRITEKAPPACPKCGHKKLARQLSSFATPRGRAESQGPAESGDDAAMPDMEDPRVMRAMSEMERDMAHLDENNPKHMAHMMKKMKELLPGSALPKELDVAIKRLESGEDPEKIEADMGDFMGTGDDEGGAAGPGGAYARDSGLYDY